MTVRPHPTHAPSLWPGVCPGGQVVRLVSNALERILVEHPLPPTLTPEGILAAADEDFDRAMNWLEGNPDDIVFAYIYDGDSGQCDAVTFLAASDVRAKSKGHVRTPVFRGLNQCVPAPAADAPETRQLPKAGG